MSDADMSDGPAYDPDQDAEEKRDVRRKYRTLQKETEGKQANVNDYTAEELVDRVGKANKLFSKVKGPQEATLDSAFLLMASNMGAQKARAMKSGAGAFDIEEFVSKLVSHMGGRNLGEDAGSGDEGGEALDWDKIACKALAKSRRVPAMGFMLGPLSIEAKKRIVGKRAVLNKDEGDKRKPQELKEEDIARSENETTKNVAALYGILEGRDPTNLFEFVINPNNFAQSVENIFYLSFLIRDGKVMMEINEEGIPMIQCCEEPTAEDYQNGATKHQIVMEFDMDTWERAIEEFNITGSIIPARAAGGVKIGNKWYG